MRRYGFDWLRIFVIFLLFPFHTARVFDAWEPNYVKGAVGGFSTWFVASLGFWIMPLLFIIAGYSAYTALAKRTSVQYIKERVLRLLVPFLLGMLLIVPPQAYIARLGLGYTGNYLQFLGTYFTDFSDLSGYTGAFTPAHLWFILYLFVISCALLPVLLSMRKRPERLRWVSRPWVMLLCVLPITLSQALPDIGGKNPFYYGFLFLLGAVFATSGVYIDILRRYKWPMLGGGLLSGIVYLVIAALYGWPEGWNAAGISYAILRNVAVWLLSLGVMAVADTCLNKPSKALSYFGRASYPVYLVHQTLLVVIAYFAVRLGVSAAPQVIIIMLGSLAVSVAGFEICRHFRVTRFMLGIK